MNQGVRAAIIAVKDGRILLVRHVHPQTGVEWWVPPGGALEDQDASIFACAEREVHEETGLQAVAGRLIYYREFRDSERDTRWVELYFLTDSLAGTLSAGDFVEKRPGEEFIREARWLAREELQKPNVYPEMLKTTFWDDLGKGFPEVRYLGLSSA